MKYLLMAICILSLSRSNAQDNNAELKSRDSTLYLKFISQKLHRYEGRTIKYLLKNSLFKNYLKQRYMDGSRIGQLKAVDLEYEGELILYIELKTFKHVTRIDKTRSWDFNLVKKEKIKKLTVFFSD